MVGYSNGAPEEFVRVGGGWQFRYNIAEVPASVERDAGYSFEFVEVAELDRGMLIDAMITAKYSYASQLGKLALSRTSTEWTTYNAFRQECYTKVEAALARRIS